jgi:hypothetical protein
MRFEFFFGGVSPTECHPRTKTGGEGVDVGGGRGVFRRYKACLDPRIGDGGAYVFPGDGALQCW